ncbi:MAG: HAMP domain-containing histidine kinase [Flavobacterium sp.]|nr:HAMP domain-containing histidine kinase [Candidatus Neoflavobacterium equi]
MKIATRFTLVFTMLTMAILFVFASSIYYNSKKARADEYFNKLKVTSLIRGEFILDSGVDFNMVKLNHLNNIKIMNESDVFIFDERQHLIYQDNPKNERIVFQSNLFHDVQNAGVLKWYIGAHQAVGTYYTFNNTSYYIFTVGYDYNGFKKIDALFVDLCWLYAITIIVIFCCGLFFSFYTLKPLKSIIDQIKKITEHNLHSRLHLDRTKDELYDLSLAFNNTLNRLERSFNNQKSFVSSISHEFRTPLSIIITELELAKETNTTVSQFEQSIDHALTDAKQLSILSTEMLDFARASYDSSQISMNPLRIDELVLDTKLRVSKKHNNYKVSVSFDHVLFDEDLCLEVNGNAYLLDVSFANLMENACKYSENKSCKVEISKVDAQIAIRFIDRGVGIPDADLEHIFTLFYRGSNKTYSQGNGVGLSLVDQIIKLHNGTITLETEQGKGSVFTVLLPLVLQ